MDLKALKGQTIGFAGSGGLDSCTITRWLADEGVKVVCFTADLGQPDETDMNEIKTRMLAAGASDFVFVPLKDEIAQAGLKAVQAQAYYEGRYWNTTAIARHVTARGILSEMRKRKISIFSHGATGRGNDQVRFQLVTNMLSPEFKVYAPWRDEAFLKRFGGRQVMIDFCNERKIPIKATKKAPYSTDANLLGLTHEAGILESLETPARAITPGMGQHSIDALGTAEDFEIRFDRGIPRLLNGQAVNVVDSLLRANEIGGRHGIGIGLHVTENRFVGIKSRGVYEAPGMELLGTCYDLLLQLVLDRRARELFNQLSPFIAKQYYQGYGFDLATQMAEQSVSRVCELATGTIKVSLYKGGISFVSASDVPHSLYREDDASMEAVGAFDHSDSEGFLGVLGVSARALAASKQIKATL